MATTQTQTQTTHTNAEYRCKVYEVRKNFYVVKMVNIAKNYGDRKTLHIPRRDLFVNKSLIEEQLAEHDYINLKFTYVDRRYDVTDILSVDMLQRVSVEGNKKTKSDNSEVSKVERVNPNKYAALAWSDSESEEDN
jgi:hypothetical protein